MKELEPVRSLEKVMRTIWDSWGTWGEAVGRAMAPEAAKRAVMAASVNCILLVIVVVGCVERIVKRLWLNEMESEDVVAKCWKLVLMILLHRRGMSDLIYHS
jgi:hypothetical protein